jgi:hypothetical protein
MKGDINSLPVWAQDRIRDLERVMDDLARQLDKAEGNFGPSNVFISGDIRSSDIPIGMNSQVRFQFQKPEEQFTERFIDIRHERDGRDRDCLVIHGDSTLLIEPSATNSIRLILARR